MVPSRVGVLQIPSKHNGHQFAGPRKDTNSFAIPVLWNYPFSEILMSPHPYIIQEITEDLVIFRGLGTG